MGKLSKPSRLSLTVILIVLLAIGAAGWYITRDDSSESYPVTNSQDSEALLPEEAPIASPSKTGTFSGVAPKSGSGNVTLFDNPDGTRTVRLEDNFTVQQGPDLYLGFGNADKVDHDTLFTELGSISGRQEYTVPPSLDVTRYTQIIVYCKEFSVVFAAANLR